MADLHQIIDAHSGANHRIGTSATINAATSANLRAIANNHPAKLRHRDMLAISGGNETEALIADTGSGMHNQMLPRDTIGQAGMGMNASIRAKLTARTDGDVVFENPARADFGPRADKNKGPDFTIRGDNRIRCDHRAWVDAGLWLSRRVEKTSNPNKTCLRRSSFQHHAARWSLICESWLNHDCAGLAGFQRRQITPPFHEGNIICPSQMQRRYAGKKPPIISGCRKPQDSSEHAERNRPG